MTTKRSSRLFSTGTGMLAAGAAVALAMWAMTAYATPAAPQAPAAAPFIAVFVVDGLRPDSIDPQVTPTLARLQREGTVYVDSHAVFPTVTRVNGASLSTGAYPNRHGLVGNTMFVPAVDPARPFSAAEWRNLARLAEVSGGRLLSTPTLAERLAARGLAFVAVSSGSTGSGFVLNPEAPRGVGAFISGGLTAGTQVAFPEPLNAAILARFGPAPPEEGAPRLNWTERVVREHVLPELRPAVMIDWLTEPDSAQHARGVGSPEGRTALGNTDRNLGLFLDAAAKLGPADRLNVIVTSDHGFARHTEAVSINGALIGAGLKASADSDDVVVASNAEAVALHVKGRDPRKVERIATFLLTQPWVDLVFTGAASGARREDAGRRVDAPAAHGPSTVYGRVPGTFAIELVRGHHADRGADLLVTFRWSSASNGFGVRGAQAIASDSQSGVLAGDASGHGGLNPWVVRNVLIAWGPRFKQATTIRVPAAIVDIAPTVAALAGVDVTDGGDGRVLREALVDGPDPEQVAVWRETYRVHTSAYEGIVQVSGTGSSWYVDKGWRLK